MPCCSRMETKILEKAASNGKFVDVKRFLSKEQRLKQFCPDDDKWEIIFLAAGLNGHDKIVRLLLKYKVCVMRHSGDKRRPLIKTLIQACEKGFIKIVHTIIKHSKLLIDCTDDSGQTALMHACHNGLDRIVQLLLKSGAYVHLEDNEGKNVIMHACIAGHGNIVRLLVEHGIGTIIDDHDKNTMTALMHACSQGHYNIVETLLKSNAYINELDKDGRTAFYYASDRDVVKLLVQYGADPNFVDEIEEKSALIRACEKGNADMVECLLECGASVTCRDMEENTALHHSCLQNSINITEILLKNGVEKWAKDDWEDLIINCCTHEGREEILKLFIKHGAPLHLVGDHYKLFLLTDACSSRKLEVVKLLLSQTNDEIYVKDFFIRSALMVACQQGCFDIVECLITMKGESIKINAKDVSGRSVLMYASEMGHDAVVSLLLKLCRCVKLNLVDKKGRTALMYACQRGHVKTMKILTSQRFKIDIGIQDESGDTALILACRHGHIEIADHLLSFGVYSNFVEDRRRALMYACQNGHEKIVELLLQRGVKVGRTCLNGLTALHLACQRGNSKIVKLLISSGCSSLKNSDIMSPLMFACVRGDEETVKILVEHDVDINVRCSVGKTALMYACVSGCEAVVEILLRANANVNATDLSGNTALTYASDTCNPKIMNELLAMKGIKVSDFGRVTCTPLTSACKWGDVSLVRQLIDLGANVNEMDYFHTTPLIYACKKGHTEIVRVLLKHDAYWDVIVIDGCGKHPLTFAWENGFDEIMRLLIKPGLVLRNLPIRSNGKTLLMYACMKGDEEMAKSLLELNQDLQLYPAACDHDDKTALFYAAENGYEKIVDLIMMKFHKESIGMGNSADRNNKTALIWACIKGRDKVVEVLLRYIGIDVVNTCDVYSKTALNYALENDHTRIALLLMREGIHLNYPAGSNDRTPLMYACLGGGAELVQQILCQGGHVNSKDRTKKTALILACEQGLGASQIVKLLLEYGADVDVKDENGKTALMSSCAKGFEEYVTMLIENGADMNARDNEEKTALMYAFTHEMDNSKMIQQLIQSEADINAHDFTGKSVLMYAVENEKDLCGLGLLFGHRVNVNKSSVRNKKTALMLACELGCNNAVSLLIQNGADLNAQNFLGHTPLMFACSKGQFEIVKALVECGANTLAFNKRHETALMVASKSKIDDDRIVKYLIKHKRDQFEIDMQDKLGNTPLMHACKAGNHVAMLALLQDGANVEIEDHEAASPLTHACSVGDVSAVDLLVTFGPKNDDSYYIEAFEFAAAMGHNEVVKLFLTKHKIDPNVYCASEKKTALLTSCESSIQVVNTLIEWGADVNWADRNGKTPLIEAIFDWKGGILASLLKQRPDIDACDKHGMTALMYACKESRSDMVKLLLVHGADSQITDRHGRDAFRLCSFKWNRDLVHLMLGNNTEGFIGVDHRYWKARQALRGCFEKTKSCAYHLIEHGIPINSQNHDGQTAIIWLASLSSRQSISVEDASTVSVGSDMKDLLDLGASIEMVDGKGETAFSYTLAGDGQNLSVLVKSGLLTDVNGRVKAVHRKAVRNIMLRKESHRISSLALGCLMINGLFEWQFCPEQLMSDMGEESCRLGYCPGSLVSAKGYLISPLISAIVRGEVWVVRLFLKALYFLPEDLVALRTDSKLHAKIKDAKLLEMVTKRNFDLESLSILSVSKSISQSGPMCKRAERVDALPLPNLLKTKLKFKDVEVQMFSRGIYF